MDHRLGNARRRPISSKVMPCLPSTSRGRTASVRSSRKLLRRCGMAQYSGLRPGLEREHPDDAGDTTIRLVLLGEEAGLSGTWPRAAALSPTEPLAGFRPEVDQVPQATGRVSDLAIVRRLQGTAAVTSRCRTRLQRRPACCCRYLRPAGVYRGRMLSRGSMAAAATSLIRIDYSKPVQRSGVITPRQPRAPRRSLRSSGRRRPGPRCRR